MKKNELKKILRQVSVFFDLDHKGTTFIAENANSFSLLEEKEKYMYYVAIDF